MGQQVKSWCRQHERLLIFISFLLLSGLSLYFVYFQENFLRAPYGEIKLPIIL